ncbi:MerR family transcriptional regulator [Rhodococcus sp. MEB041]|uniref:MerR family transcriptional regulator n=1 Tax=Rhodococcus sp. MEB041 TaxID=3040323 RepID=UPI00254A89AE|nr:MerR family transcriptional regulator [Rhodococcus sp. MEB041]
MSENAIREGSGEVWKVGALAQRTGLSVRALHHYDQIGLLTPSQRSTSGHRLYSAADAERLYRIRVLRRLGFPLDHIADLLSQSQWQLEEAVANHLVDARHTASVATRLVTRLSDIATALQEVEGLSTEQLFSTIEEMTMLETPIRETTSMLVYDDLAAAHDHLVHVLGLSAGPLHVDDDGAVVHAEVRAGHHVIWLHPCGEGYQPPARLGAATGMTVIVVDDVDEHHRRCTAAGAEVIEEPIDQPYGVREWGARDPEGQQWFFHSPPR